VDVVQHIFFAIFILRATFYKIKSIRESKKQGFESFFSYLANKSQLTNK